MGRSRLLLVLLAMTLIAFSMDLSNAAGQLQVTVSTNKPTYGPGELVSVNGQVLDGSLNGVPFASVSIQANDPSGNPIHVAQVLSSADGSYSDQFRAPLDPVNGGYAVYVTASKPGYADANSQAACIITPEFPTSQVPLLMVLPAILLVLLAGRHERGSIPSRNGGRQEKELNRI